MPGQLYYLICFLFIHGPAVSLAREKTFTLSEFLSSSLRNDELLQIENFRREIQKGRLHIARDLYRSQLETRFQRRREEASFPLFPGPNNKFERSSLWANYRQNLPLGLQADFSTTRFLGDSHPSLGGIDRDWQAGLTIPLLKNQLGRQDRRSIRTERLRLQLTDQSYQRRLAERCSASLESYINYYRQMRIAEFTGESLELARDGLEQAEKAFNQRLVRKIDILNARADFLDVKSVSERTQNEKDIAKQKLLGHLNQEVSLYTHATPSSPADFFLKLNVESREDNLQEVEFLAWEKKVLNEEFESVRERYKPALNLSLQISERKGETNIGSQFSDYKENVILAQVGMEIPVLSREKSVEVQNAYLQKKIKEYELQEALRRSRVAVEEQRTRVNSVETLMARALERVTLYEQQAKEVLRLVSVGNADYEDFIQVRRRLLAEKNEIERMQSEKWFALIQNHSLSNSLSEICSEYL